MNNHLNQDDIIRIKQSSYKKRLYFRIKYGFISLTKSPFKAIITLMYAISVIVIFNIRVNLINDLLQISIWRKIAQTSQDVFTGVFTYGIPILSILIFLLLLSLFGYPISWVGKKIISANNAEDAFLSAGIFTQIGKLPWLLSIQKSNDKSSKKILEIFLNGNAKSIFDTKKEFLESELGITIDEIQEKSKQIILITVYPGDFTKHRKVIEDPFFKK